MRPGVFLQAALNGDRVHSGAPRSPTAIAEAARAAVDAGAHAVHVHAFDDAGHETLDGTACADVLRAIRARCPGTPVSLTTSATIVSDARERLEIVEAWEELPDLVTANQGEPGIGQLCALLLSRGVGIEAGLLSSDDARAFVRSGLAERCRRVLIEPLDVDPDTAVQHAAAMEEIVTSAGIALEQVHHGYGVACWAVNRRALGRGHGIRTGLEDVTLLPDGTEARDNAELVVAAAQMVRPYATILELVERLNAAWPAGDFDQLTEIFDPGAVLVSPAPEGERRIVGRDAVIQSYRDFVGQSVLHSFEMAQPDIDVFGATAIASCPYRVDYEVGGRRWVGAGRDVLVLSEGSQGWNVVWRTLLPGEERESMDPTLHRFLAGCRLLSEEATDWGVDGVPYPVALRWYACVSSPPDRFVVSVRAVVVQGEEVLVLKDRVGGVFVASGGHRKEGETLGETVVREVMEECGWIVEPISIIATLHIHASGRQRTDRPYPYPDSVHVTYAARAVARVPDWRREDDWVIDSAFVPIEEALEMEMDPGQHALLDLAKAAVGQDSDQGEALGSHPTLPGAGR